MTYFPLGKSTLSVTDVSIWQENNSCKHFSWQQSLFPVRHAFPWGLIYPVMSYNPSARCQLPYKVTANDAAWPWAEWQGLQEPHKSFFCLCQSRMWQILMAEVPSSTGSTRSPWARWRTWFHCGSRARRGRVCWYTGRARGETMWPWSCTGVGWPCTSIWVSIWAMDHRWGRSEVEGKYQNLGQMWEGSSPYKWRSCQVITLTWQTIHISPSTPCFAWPLTSLVLVITASQMLQAKSHSLE